MMAIKNAFINSLRLFGPRCGSFGLVNLTRCASSTQSNAKNLRERAVNLSFVSYENSTEETFDQPNKAPPIIIMHGLLGSKANWNSLAKQIHHKTKRKIIAVDARNHGDSPHSAEMDYYLLAEDVVKLMDDLGIERATLVGHSMGGRAMMLLALTKPQYVEMLFPLDISPVSDISGDVSDMMRIFNGMAEAEILQGKSMAVVRKSLDEQLAKVVIEPMIRQFLLTNLVQDNSTGMFRWRMNLKALAKNFQPHLSTFPPVKDTYEGPTYFIGGGRSEYLRKEDHGAILKLFPRAEFHYIADAGHWIHSEKPTQFLDIFLGCLEKAKKKRA